MLHLWTSLLCAVMLPVSIGSGEGGPWLRVKVHMAESGFMCPFLTPMFVEILEDKEADWVLAKPQESVVEWSVPLHAGRSQEGYVDWLTALGYGEEQITFLQFDTLQVQPSIPAP